MSLIVGEKIVKNYAALEVLKSISFRLEADDRVGLVGPNGEGKSTLMKILAQVEEYQTGTMSYAKGLRIGYLPQNPPDLQGASLWDALWLVFKDLHDIEHEMHELAIKMGEDHSEDITNRYAELQDQFIARDGYTIESRIRQVLSGLGFTEAQYELPLGKLSGGQKTRAFLARLLLDEPDILLMDEPTNHLDLDAIEWLETYLKEFKKTLLVVSHDRYFLDQTVNKIWEINFGTLETYRGNYSSYLKQREERYVERMRTWEAQQRYIEETEEFIRRFLAGQRSKEAQGRRSILERFKRDEAIPKPRIPPKMRMSLRPERRTGDLVLKLTELVAGYTPEKPLVKVPQLEIRRNDPPARIALVGPNGAGKTTLLRTLLGDLKALGGEVRWGTNVDLGYLSQAHYDLDPEQDVLNSIRWAKDNVLEEQARTYMGNFLFTGDDAYKKVGSLSGGQRSRVALARLAIKGCNILLLDEPTNHLDLVSQEILQDVLCGFEGVVIFVSHDRFLVQGLANQIWVVDHGTVTPLDGGWKRYLQYREEMAAKAQKAADKIDAAEEKAKAKAKAEEEARKAAEAAKSEAAPVAPPKKKAPQKLTRKIAEAESDIQKFEEQLKNLNEQIEQAAKDQAKVRELGTQYAEIQQKLQAREAEWASLGEELQQYEVKE